ERLCPSRRAAPRRISPALRVHPADGAGGSSSDRPAALRGEGERRSPRDLREDGTGVDELPSDGTVPALASRGFRKRERGMYPMRSILLASLFLGAGGDANFQFRATALD